MVCLYGRYSPWPFSSSLQRPCRWIGCSIIESLISTKRTRSPRCRTIGPASENFLPSKPQMKRSMLPVRWRLMSREGGRRSPPGRAAQIGVGQHPPPGGKTFAGAVQALGRHLGDIVDADAALKLLDLGARRPHAGHGTMVHLRHRVMVHAHAG